MDRSEKKYLEGQIKNFQEALDNFVDEQPDVDPKIVKASKEAIVSKLEEFKNEFKKIK